MALSSGDRVILVRAGDGKLVPIPVTAATSVGDRCILARCGDGKLVPVKVEAADTVGDRCILGLCGDGKLVPLSTGPFGRTDLCTLTGDLALPENFVITGSGFPTEDNWERYNGEHVLPPWYYDCQWRKVIYNTGAPDLQIVGLGCFASGVPGDSFWKITAINYKSRFSVHFYHTPGDPELCDETVTPGTCGDFTTSWGRLPSSAKFVVDVW